MPGFLAFIPLIEKVFDRVMPNKEAAAEAKHKLKELAQHEDLAELDSETKIALAQIGVNKTEAGNANVFVSGWRPAVGWVCVTGLGWNFVLQPFVKWATFLAGGNLTGSPVLDVGDLMVLLGGMLGLGTLRTAEKMKGVARS